MRVFTVLKGKILLTYFISSSEVPWPAQASPEQIERAKPEINLQSGRKLFSFLVKIPLIFNRFLGYFLFTHGNARIGRFEKDCTFDRTAEDFAIEGKIGRSCDFATFLIGFSLFLGSAESASPQQHAC